MKNTKFKNENLFYKTCQKIKQKASNPNKTISQLKPSDFLK
jgi:hypothetical protein